MIRVDIGDIVIKKKVKGAIKDKLVIYTFKPSFENISKIGDKREIIERYSTLLDNKHLILASKSGIVSDSILTEKIQEHIRKQEEIADKILSSCCNIQPPKLKIDTKIMIAIALMQHGVNGMAQVRISQRNQTTKKLQEFDVNQYIMSARVNLGMGIDEAKTLTMTEFILLMAMKYPDNEGLTAQEYDEVMADFERKKKKRLEAEKRA